jgi:hypothetical protein
VAYAALEDVLARAGRLRTAWDETTDPATSEIESFLEQEAGTLDAVIGSRGFAVPVTDPIAAKALIGVNADRALLLAIRATWPGGRGSDAVRDLLDDVKARVAGYDAAIAAGNLAALLYLSSQSSAAQEGGASDFWTNEGADYDYWERFAGSYPNSWLSDPWGIPPSQQPQFSPGVRLD